MKIVSKRACIYPKDIQNITGKSYRQSTRLFKKIKDDLNKSDKAFVSIEEFCRYTGLQYEHIASHIVG
ncbi:hypothetical protein ABGT15_06865 [Flavobacterium enshiense]|uniref:hypothetical protein n=1 Tax=Flavobacterium enshiense TaxID=1341165 RepID=UPI00345DF11C